MLFRSVARGLLDEDASVHERARALLSDPEGGVRVPPAAALDALVAALIHRPDRAWIADYLVAVAIEDRAIAARLLADLGTPPLAAVAAQLEQVVTGDDLCALCLSLPREASWSHELSAPKGFGRLENVGPFHVCPTCRTAYVHTYDDEWEIGRAHV